MIRRRTRAFVAVAAAASVTAAVLVAGPGYDAARVRMSSGAVWLASSGTGEVSLVDGTTGEVRGHTRVAAPGTALSVARLGSAAFVANRKTGQLSRVDSATEQVSPSGADLPASDGLVVKTTPDVVHGIDVRSGTVVSVDPHTLRSSGDRTRLAERLQPDSVVVDGGGRLWAIDADTGDLVWLADGKRRSRPAEAGNSRLTVTTGRPVLVDPERDVAELLHPGTGVVAGTVRPGLDAGDVVAVSGSADRSRVLIANSTRGELVVCAFDPRSCTAPVKVAAEGADLGTPVEVDDHAVVPDYSTGEATVVDLADGSVVSQRLLFAGPVRFELVVHDNLVFFNDPNSNAAGVLKLTGDVMTITKHAEAPTGDDGVGQQTDPRAQQAQQETKIGQPERTPAPGLTGQPALPDSSTPEPKASIVVTPGNRGAVGDEFELTMTFLPAVIADADWQFGDGTTGRGATVRHRWQQAGEHTVEAVATLGSGQRVTARTTIVVDPAGTPPQITGLSVQRPKPVVGELVRISAGTSGRPDMWAWTVTRAGRNRPEATAGTAEFSHRFTTAGQYTVSLTITRGTTTATSSQEVTVARGAVEGWGRNRSGVLDIPPAATSGVIAVAAGDAHALALKADGSVIAWGDNSWGQVEVPPEASSGVVAIDAGQAHSLALKADGTVIGWGGKGVKDLEVVPPAARSDVIAISAGFDFGLVLKKDGSVVSWGASPGNVEVPPAARSDVIAISAGFLHCLALKADGSVIGWEGDEGGHESATTTPPEARAGVVAVAANGWSSLALKSDGSVIGWGDNDWNQISIPQEAKSGVIAIDTSLTHSVALKSNGTVLAWGANDFAQTAVPPQYNSGVLSVSAGKQYNLVLV
ncbi:PKD domain-containing protein [Lentzea sp. NEAU-D13]|uniref:PKD domain-containing protein n=1 Tax=Lentzea alba TaxID=2714351 RepID=A0A7C9VP53_9PSEU|nr:PKD domain-containing protein [Lentzea alba]NGY60413.1 PKD domain-containing protein [Lentzea alba]